MANNLQTDEVELELAERTDLINKYSALQRLKENSDFKELVLEGYIRESAIDKVSLLGTDYVRQNSLRGPLMEELVAISVFEGYLKMIENLGAPALEEAEAEEE